MEVSLHADLSFRVLMYLAVAKRMTRIQQISTAYGASNNHLVKVVHRLSRAGFVKTTPGRNGGIELARLPEDINLGDVLRKTEPSFKIFECFDPEHNTCPITSVCKLIAVADAALDAFLKTFDGYTLADVISKPAPLREALGIGVKAARSARR